MNTIPYIGFFRRAIAFIIDSLIAAIIPAIICIPMMLSVANNTNMDTNTEAGMLTLFSLAAVYILWQILGLVSFWLYFALLESGHHQATWGKRLVGIKVVDYKGNRITFARATGRLFAKFLSYATLYIGFIMAGTTRRKRALHDYIAQTYVVRKNFQPGDDLPDTKSHLIWLCLITFVFLALSAIGFLSLLANSTAIQAKGAAQRLEQLAQEKQTLREPLLENGITYSRARDGYRAQFEDWEAETYILRLDPKTSTVCCEDLPGGDCSNTQIPECN